MVEEEGDVADIEKSNCGKRTNEISFKSGFFYQHMASKTTNTTINNFDSDDEEIGIHVEPLIAVKNYHVNTFCMIELLFSEECR